MPLPTYAARPLSTTFLLARLLQTLIFALTIYLTATFISRIIATPAVPPTQLILTLTTTSLAAFYTLISLPFYWAQATRGLLIMCLIDLLMAAAFAVVAVVLGRPVSYLSCASIPKSAGGNALQFASSLATNIGKDGELLGWVGATRLTCYEVKVVWGASIALR